MFRVCETYGIPLELIVEQLYKHSYIIDWIDFYEDSLSYGWNPRTTLSKIEVALFDTHGKLYSQEVIDRLKYYIVKRSENEN